VGFYTRAVYPRLCDRLLGRPAVARHRRALLADAAGDVLEIGFGTGLNLPCYPRGVRQLTAVDPNPGTHPLARRRIKRSGIAVDHRVLSGEQLSFPDGTFDCVVSTFTLCSIAGVGQALAEAYRVLRPGGRFLFLEHGPSPDPAVRRWQRGLNWLEMRLADGCRLDRDVRGLVVAQPFAAVRVDQFYLPGLPRTHGYMTRGVATK
jgi:SAM-dependent methyltransferase